MDDLLRFILEIEKRPGLYIGNTDLRCLSHFLNGYIWAKAEHAGNELFGKWLNHNFRIFLVKKYNDNSAYGWAELIGANESDGNSTDTFFRLLHEYLSSTPNGDIA